MLRAWFQQPLPILFQLADAKVADAAGPRVVVSSHTGVQVPEQEKVFGGRNLSDGCLQLLVKEQQQHQHGSERRSWTTPC